MSNDLAAKVKFASDSTCCVCRVRRKTIQIHHIDGNPSNNDFTNLAILCLEDHNSTQLKGGFGRRLDSDEIVEYRDDWINRVRKRRNVADEKAAKMQVETQSRGNHLEKHSLSQATKLKDPSVEYINALPNFKSALLAQRQPKLDRGSTMTIVQARHDYIDSITGILVVLSSYYSPEQFGNLTPQVYFSEIVSSRIRWHYTIVEPGGRGTGGTIIRILIASGVETDVEHMVEDMVYNLVYFDDSFDWDDWRQRWRGNFDTAND